MGGLGDLAWRLQHCCWLHVCILLNALQALQSYLAGLMKAAEAAAEACFPAQKVQRQTRWGQACKNIFIIQICISHKPLAYLEGRVFRLQLDLLPFGLL